MCPVYITKLEFKSKEELQLMPQTQEEHLENESIEDDKLEDKNPDAEVKYFFLNFFFRDFHKGFSW